jgi:hypothetical protein
MHTLCFCMTIFCLVDFVLTELVRWVVRRKAGQFQTDDVRAAMVGLMIESALLLAAAGVWAIAWGVTR